MTDNRTHAACCKWESWLLAAYGWLALGLMVELSLCGHYAGVLALPSSRWLNAGTLEAVKTPLLLLGFGLNLLLAATFCLLNAWHVFPSRQHRAWKGFHLAWQLFIVAGIVGIGTGSLQNIPGGEFPVWLDPAITGALALVAWLFWGASREEKTDRAPLAFWVAAVLAVACVTHGIANLWPALGMRGSEEAGTLARYVPTWWHCIWQPWLLLLVVFSGNRAKGDKTVSPANFLMWVAYWATSFCMIPKMPGSMQTASFSDDFRLAVFVMHQAAFVGIIVRQFRHGYLGRYQPATFYQKAALAVGLLAWILSDILQWLALGNLDPPAWLAGTAAFAFDDLRFFIATGGVLFAIWPREGNPNRMASLTSDRPALGIGAGLGLMLLGSVLAGVWRESALRAPVPWPEATETAETGWLLRGVGTALMICFLLLHLGTTLLRRWKNSDPKSSNQHLAQNSGRTPHTKANGTQSGHWHRWHWLAWGAASWLIVWQLGIAWRATPLNARNHQEVYPVESVTKWFEALALRYPESFEKFIGKPTQAHAQVAWELGQRSYISQGCWQCHVPHDSAVISGKRPIRPPLSRFGGHRSYDWHAVHLFEPGAFDRGTKMPAYTWLFEGSPSKPTAEGLSLLFYLQLQSF